MWNLLSNARPTAPPETRFVDFVYQPIKDASGKVHSIFVQDSDTTDQHVAVDALRASGAQLRALNADLERRVIERAQARTLTWQLSPDLLGALNSQGYFETSNPAWKIVLGWSEREVAGMSIFELLHPEDLEHTRAGFELTYPAFLKLPLPVAIYDRILFFDFQRTPTGARLHPAWGWMFGRYLMVIWWKGLRWAEGLSGGRVQRRPSRRVVVDVGKSRGHREQDAPETGLHQSADLEQLQANRATGRVGEARVGQADAPERAHQHVGE